jgi:hypothetical protein
MTKRNRSTRHHPLAFVALASLAVAACGSEPAEQTELTRAQKDSIVADLPIPGASGVAGALQARDRANARAAQLDSAGGRSP